MSNVPAGATLSEDGHYWWDGQEWQLVQQQQYDGGTGGGDGGTGGEAPAGQAIIAFTDVYAGDANTGMGPRVIIDVDDNPDNHHVLHVGAGCVAVWGEINSGNADAVNYSDQYKIDGVDHTVDELNLGIGQHTTRSVKLGRLTAGKHDFEITLNGGPAWGEDHQFDVSDI